MSDGMSDAAYDNESRARKFVAEKWPGLKIYEHPMQVPARGKCVLIYETHLDYNIELIENRVMREGFKTHLTETHPGGHLNYVHEILPYKKSKRIVGSRYYRQSEINFDEDDE